MAEIRLCDDQCPRAYPNGPLVERARNYLDATTPDDVDVVISDFCIGVCAKMHYKRDDEDGITNYEVVEDQGPDEAERLVVMPVEFGVVSLVGAPGSRRPTMFKQS